MQKMQETLVQSLGQEDPWRRKWQPTPVFLPGNAMDRGAWQATVHGVAKNWTQLSNFHFTLRVNSKVAVKGEKARDYYFFSWGLVALQCC